jgi:hypothetical protein
MFATVLSGPLLRDLAHDFRHDSTGIFTRPHGWDSDEKPPLFPNTDCRSAAVAQKES